jgi:curli production assembly/transport component CsgG
MRRLLSLILMVSVISGCATGELIRQGTTGEKFQTPKVYDESFLKRTESQVLPPQGGPMIVAVYGFMDKTGQRKSIPNIASLSSAVTQGGETYLIKALQDVGQSRWFTVVERVGLDNLIKERQMIRQMREAYLGKDNAKPLPPMLFAGLIVEGSIVGYDSNTLAGGAGARLFGIGASTQYQSDTVTINLRTVSVASGEVLTSVTITKTVLSYQDKVSALKFVSDGENAVEAEIGATINESINIATSKAVEAAVVETIREGARKGHWSFKADESTTVSKGDKQ